MSREELAEMITCKRATELVSQSLDTRLALLNRLSLWLHLLICKYCVSFKTQLAIIRVVVAKLREEKQLELAKTAKDRIREKIRNS